MLTLLLGGTFDPVHAGHLALARCAADTFDGEVRLLPSGTPPHRAPPEASASQRLAMLRLAVEGDRRLQVDPREASRPGPSYTVDTLLELRNELGDTAAVGLILGGDAFLGLPTWHRWQMIPQLSHLIVVTRPGTRLDQLPPALQGALQDGWTAEPARLRQRPAGLVHQLSMSPLDISSTAVRAALRSGEVPAALPPAVADYICQQRLYQSA